MISDHHGWIMNARLPFPSVSELCDNMTLLWENGHHGYNELNDRLPEYSAEKMVTSTSLHHIKLP